MKMERNHSTWNNWAAGLACAASLSLIGGCSQQKPAARTVTSRTSAAVQPTLGIELKDNNGSLSVGRVVEGSAAEAAGMREGDRLVSVNGHPLSTSAQLISHVQTAAESDGKLSFKVRRNDETKNLLAQLDAADAKTAQRSSSKRHEVGYRGNNNSTPSPAVGDNSSAQTSATDTEPADTPPTLLAANTSSEVSQSSPEQPDSAASISSSDAQQSDRNNPAQPASQAADASQAARQAQQESQQESQQEAKASFQSDEPSNETQKSNDTTSNDDQSQTTSKAAAAVDDAVDATTLQQVERELSQARDALRAVAAEKEKRDFQLKMMDQLRTFDKDVASLQREADELIQQLSDKQQQLQRIRAKRETFVTEIENLESNTSRQWQEQRERIESAWSELQHAFTGSGSASAQND